jgi:hypothetical protein
MDFQVSQPVLMVLAMCCRTSLSSALSSFGSQYPLRGGEGSWPIVICPLRTVICAIEMNVVVPNPGVCLFDIRSLVNGEYQDRGSAEIPGSQLGLHSKRRNENNSWFTLACRIDGFGILRLHNHLYYEIGFL